VLTVVANESYEKFLSALQSEIAFEYREEIEARYGKSIEDLSDEERAAISEEYGKGILPPKPADANKRAAARLRKEYQIKSEFKELWERIKHKTRYAVTIDSEKLIQDVISELSLVDVNPPRVTISKVSLDVSDENIFEALQISAHHATRALDSPDFA
jgi:type III restriction enzyme